MIYHLVFYLCTCVMLGITHFTRTAYVHDRSPFHRQYVADGGQITTLAWAVALKPHQVVSMETLVHNIARDVGLVCHGQIGELRGHFLFSFNPLSTDINVWNELNNTTIKNNVTEVSVNGSMDSFMFNYGAVKKYVENKLRSHLLVESFHQQVFRKRVKRSLEFLDPLFPKQWHLVNTKDHWKDINVSGVWEFNITGRGVTVCVVDDGVDWKNPDLEGNYRAEGSWDLNDDDEDPSPEHHEKASNNHGTRCAGEIAAGSNTYCGVGVAYNAYISGLRALDGTVTDSLEATAFNMKMDVNDIYSCSWGPEDDGQTVDGPHYLAQKAMELGTQVGRRGYGSIYVVASGNGGSNSDNCNFDGYANSIYTITIGAVDENGHIPYYAEECPAMLAVTYSSGSNRKWDIVTTDWMNGGKDGGCTMHHTGTSAAAPLAAGMVALMLEARPCLSWRDIQYIIIVTAIKVDVEGSLWYDNKAGLSHSNTHGFGLLSAWKLVNIARVWPSVPWKTQYKSAWQHCDKQIPLDPEALTRKFYVSKAELKTYGLFILEYVQVRVSITHPRRGSLLMWLKCPSGTITVLATPRPKDNHTEGFNKWTLTTVRCWGEEPYGEWVLGITDNDRKTHAGQLKSWQLILHGTPMSLFEFQQRLRFVRDSIHANFLDNDTLYECQEVFPLVQVLQLPEKVLKVLVIAGVFMVIISIYETLEYMCCYQEDKMKVSKVMHHDCCVQVGGDDEMVHLLDKNDTHTSGDEHSSVVAEHSSMSGDDSKLQLEDRSI